MSIKERVKENLGGAEKQIFEMCDFPGVNWEEMNLKEAIETAQRMISRVDTSKINLVEQSKKVHIQIILKTGNSINIEIEECEEVKKEYGEIDMEKLLKCLPENWEKKVAFLNANDVSAVLINKR